MIAETLKLRDGETIELLDHDNDGRWLGTHEFKIIVPEDWFSLTELTAAPGHYYVSRHGKDLEKTQFSDYVTGSRLPSFPPFTDRGVELKKKKYMEKYDITIDFKKTVHEPRKGRQTKYVKSYVLEKAYDSIDNCPEATVKRKTFDTIRRVYPKATAFFKDKDEPLYFGYFSDYNKVWNWVAYCYTENLIKGWVKQEETGRVDYIEQLIARVED